MKLQSMDKTRSRTQRNHVKRLLIKNHEACMSDVTEENHPDSPESQTWSTIRVKKKKSLFNTVFVQILMSADTDQSVYWDSFVLQAFFTITIVKILLTYCKLWMQCIRNFYHTLSWELYLRFSAALVFLWIWISMDIYTPHLNIPFRCEQTCLWTSKYHGQRLFSDGSLFLKPFIQAYSVKASVWTDTIFCDRRKRFTLTLTSE